MNTLANQAVLLTGASGGLGTYIAHALSQEKATIVAVSRSPHLLERLCADIQSSGGKAIAIPFDLQDIDQLPQLVKQVNQQVGSIDVLINNAAIEKYRPFQAYQLKDIQSILTTNLIAAMELSRLLLPDMVHRNSGHIVNIASGSGKKGAPYNSIYSASKGGMILWTDAMRQELATTGVGVSLICPGYTAAGMFLDFGLPAPSLAKVSPPSAVANAVVDAIQHNRAEIILDGFLTQLLFAVTQFAPAIGDVIYRRVGLTQLNQTCAERQMKENAIASNGDRVPNHMTTLNEM